MLLFWSVAPVLTDAPVSTSPAILYSFSFAPKKNWTTLHPPGSEITQYLADVCEKYRIVDKIQLNTDINELRWIEDAEEWEVTLSHLVPGTGDLSKLERDSLVARKGQHSVYVKTEVVRAKIVVSGVGGIVEPKTWPEDIPGIEAFEGEILHTARWNSDADLQGKDVVVVGAGCSAAQVIPKLIKPEFNVKSVTQLMRTPPWVQPNMMEPGELRLWEKYSPMLFSNIPGTARIARSVLFFMLELSFFRMFKNGGIFNRLRSWTEKLFLDNMRCLAPAKYHEILTPNYSLGCKRRIIDNDWYVSLQDSNVELTTLALTRIQPKSVIIGPSRHYAPGSIAEVGEAKEVPADTIILANGYQTNRWFHSLQVIGRNGKNLEDVWNERGGAQAYLGIAMDQFPNFFMVFGPNTATGHTSVIFASENAVNYSLNFMKPILDGHVSTFEVTEEAERNWTGKIQKALQNTVFQRGACTSWYQTKDGWNSSTYP